MLQQTMQSIEGGGFVSANIVGAGTAAPSRHLPPAGPSASVARFRLLGSYAFVYCFLLPLPCASSLLGPAPPPSSVTPSAPAAAVEHVPSKKKPAATAAKAAADAAAASNAPLPMAPGRMWEVNSQELRLTDQVIGKGSFCSVVKGIFNGAVVAVRSPCLPSPSLFPPRCVS